MRMFLACLIALSALGGAPANAAVTLDACSTHASASTTTTVSDNNQTVGAALTNGILTVVAVVGSNNTISAVTAKWDNAGTPQTMTAVPGSPATNGNESIYAFYLLNPTAGNKQLQVTWTTNADVSVVACSWQGASGVANFNSANGGTPQTVAITAGANDMVMGGFSAPTNFTSTGATQIDIENTLSQWAIAWQRAAGPTPTLTGNPGNATSLSAGFSITSAGGGGATCVKGSLALMGAGC